eukprot:gene4359-8674_t
MSSDEKSSDVENKANNPVDVVEVKGDSPEPIERFSRKWFGFADKFQTTEIHQIPPMSYLELFLIFLSFGCRAFGGPVAQINMMKEELIIEKKWISMDRFYRVYSVYQILPGPEATELAIYFGTLAKGHIGGILGGLGFLLPGVCLMLLWSWIYVEFGSDNRKVQASFHALQVAVSTFIFRATYKLAEHALHDSKKKIFSWEKGFLCMFCFLTSTIQLNFFISLAVSGVINTIFESNLPYKLYVGYFIAACTLGFYTLYVLEEGIPGGSMIGGSITSTGKDIKGLFELGLVAGMVTFGGAYTTLPFIYADAVEHNGWLTSQQFLDSLAITNILPTPLVSFVTMVGFIGAGIGGALVITIGIFLPAFSFPLIGHNFFEALVDNKLVAPFLDGVSAAVIGLLATTAFTFMKMSVSTGIDAVVFLLSFYAVFTFTDKFTQPVIIAVAAIAGQVIYN